MYVYIYIYTHNCFYYDYNYYYYYYYFYFMPFTKRPLRRARAGIAHFLFSTSNCSVQFVSVPDFSKTYRFGSVRFRHLPFLHS